MRICFFLVATTYFCFLFGCEQSRKEIGKPASISKSKPNRHDLGKTEKGNRARKKDDIGLATFETPIGWLANKSNGNTVRVLVREGTAGPAPQELISIDIGKAKTENAKKTAEQFSKKFSGTVTELPFLVDSEIAYRISVPANYSRLSPRECIVFHRNNKAILLIAGSKAKTDAWPPLKDIAESWIWK